MKITLASLLALVAITISANANAQRTPEPIVNYENVVINTNNSKKLSSGEIKAAITNVANRQNWQIADNGEGKLAGTLNVRNKHTIVVNISYTPESFSVTYKDSTNMKYAVSDDVVRDSQSPWLIKATNNKQFVIHPFYNRWVKSLVDAIRSELQKL